MNSCELNRPKPPTPASRLTATRLAVLAGLLVIAAAAPSIDGTPPTALAEVSEQTPTFTNPLVIDNAYMPISPGAVKVYSGREFGDAVTFIEAQTRDTRTFEWGGGEVTCRVVEELGFVDGALVGSEQTFLAQADDGSVWAFGETEDDDPDDDDGDDDKDANSGWIVGQLAPGDAEDLAVGQQPQLVMPALPEATDEWWPENIEPDQFTRATVLSVTARSRVPAGRFKLCLRVREHDVTDGAREMRWYAPGLGLVKVRGRRERLWLQATTLRRGRRR